MSKIKLLMNRRACACACQRDGSEIESANSVDFLFAIVQTESTADGDAAVFIPHTQPQLTSAPSLHTVDGAMYTYGRESDSLKARRKTQNARSHSSQLNCSS